MLRCCFPLPKGAREDCAPCIQNELPSHARIPHVVLGLGSTFYHYELHPLYDLRLEYLVQKSVMDHGTTRCHL